MDKKVLQQPRKMGVLLSVCHSRESHRRNEYSVYSTEYIWGRVEIGGVYLPSQQERTLQLCT
jgi:hypothetical protein